MIYSQILEKALQSLDWHRQPLGLYEPIEYTLSSGGKRLRPQLVLMATEMFGGDTSKAINAALAIEVFHNFTLLHDDVMDNAPIRRGKPTVHKRWNANTAILSGDQMMIEAYTLIQDYSKEVWQVFNQMAREICEGQQRDIDFETQASVKTEEYIEMIRQKTSVLLGAALKIGAIIADANEQQKNAIYDFGVNLGLAFQIQDDYLDCFGDESTFGKRIGGDILEEKKTWLRITAEKINGGKLKVERAGKTEEEYIRQVCELYKELCVPQLAQQAIFEYTQKALQKLSEIDIDEQKKQPLKELANKLIKRNL